MSKRCRFIVGTPAAVLAASVLCLGAPALMHGDETITTSLSMPVHFDGVVTLEGTNNPGPTITISGNLALGGLGVKAIFRNNQKGTHEHEEDFTASGTIFPKDATISIPKQPVLGGAGGNPFVWVQLLTGAGKELTGEIFIGRIVQGLTTTAFEGAFPLAVTANAEITIDCENNPGPFITVDGFLAVSGLKARFIFRNNDNPAGGPHKADAVVTSTLIDTGAQIKFPKQPSLGGVGGNPWIWVQWIDGDGDPLGDEIPLGRCVQGSD
jgi:hypothetical protein